MQIDVIVPCVRPEQLDLRHLANLKVPEDFSVEFFVVIDRPDFDLSGIILPGNANIHLFRNHINLGAGETRNVGLEMGHGDLVLFFDDDVVPREDILVEYARAAAKHPDSPGFVGVTEFPAPTNRFTAGVKSSDILTFFAVAGIRETVKWGTTSNLMLRRKRIGEHKFDGTFPKSGGGEDIDFCLRIQSASSNDFVTVPSAVAVHEWWGSGRRDYGRFFRWAFGDCILPSRFPAFRYRNFPSYPEFSLAELVVLTPFILLELVNPFAMVVSLAISFVSDIFVEIVRAKVTRPRANTIHAIEGGLVRLSNDLGRLAGNLSRGRVLSITERFDYFTTGESVSFERRIAGMKFILYVVSLLICLNFL